MFWLLFIGLPLIVTVYWLMQTTSRKNSFIVLSSNLKTDLYQYLSVPNNLTKYHPSIEKVTDMKKDSEVIFCTVEENLGILGKYQIPLSVSTFSDVTSSSSSSSVRLEFLSKDLKVTIKLIISDHDDENRQEKSKIDAVVLVEGQRLITILFTNSITQKWVKALNQVETVVEQWH